MTFKKLVLIGVESSGKTTLAQALAEKLQGTYVPEYARMYLNAHGLSYQQEDLLAIAKGQSELIKEACNKVFGSCDAWIEEQIKNEPSDYYILCAPDIDWEYDPQRTLPNLEDRLALHRHYKSLLQQLHCNFIEVNGALSNRVQQVIAALSKGE
jgi:nicotinamide riboside kinase